VQWGGSGRTTTFVSSTQLQAHITTADLATPGTVSVTVVNPAPGGGSSVMATFAVAVDTIVFESERALDGSDAINTGLISNIWVMNPDGSGATPLTQLTALSSDSTAPAWSPDGSKIAFDSQGALDGSNASNHTTNIWVMNADGSGRTPLTTLTHVSGIRFLPPAWSPDGTHIACDSLRALDGSDAASPNNISNIWVMNPDGTNQTPLSKLTKTSSVNPVWSPSGSRIAFESSRVLDGADAAIATVTNIWLMNADGSGPIALTKLMATNVSSVGPVWSPDGSKIAFLSTRALDGSDTLDTNSIANLWVMNADGSGAAPLTRLTAAFTDISSPVWSPDGSKIGFSSSRALDGSDAVDTNGDSNAWVVNADGSGATPLTRLTALFAESSFSAWSPDGSKLFFVSSRALDGSDHNAPNSTFNIWVMNADGSAVTPLTKITAGGSSRRPSQP
jgi:Tol biopolymer transport system component